MKVYYKNPKAPRPTRPLTPGICAVIVNKNDQILLHRREDNKMWTLPGGKMKIGESISDCCRREIEEELSLKVKIRKVIGIYTSPDYVFDFGNGLIFQPFIVAFSCSATSNNFKINGESVEAKWFSAEEISKLDMLSNTVQIIKHYLHKIDTFFD